MSATTSPGVVLAERLGLSILGTEGHDLKCPCVACDSSDAGRVHQDTGVYYCHSCQKALSPFDLCKVMMGDHEEAKNLMIQVGLFEDNHYNAHGTPHTNGHSMNAEQAFLSVCTDKNVPPDAWRAYGAKPDGGGVRLPMFGLDGEECSTMLITPSNGKGKYEKGKPTGLFLPGRLPAPGETWCIVEGGKDPAALYALGFLAAGLPSNRLSAKFAEVFRDVDVVLATDGDKPGRDGGQSTYDLLVPIARSIKICSFPDGGMDARDVIKKDGKAGIERVLRGAKSASSIRLLPPIRDAHDLLGTPCQIPAELIKGMLHCGSKLSLGGASKGYKTWTLDDLAISVAYGVPFLGCETMQSKVLLLDLELQEAFCKQRIQTLLTARGLTSEPGRLDVWNLRGYTAGHSVIFPKIIERISGGDYGLVVLDPIYKLYGGATDENSAGDVAALMNSIESLTTETGAAVAFGAHFSKGNQAGKESIDRVSGSGVFARDPDSLLSLTAHAEESCYTLDATLRNFAPMEPFVVRWSFPLFDRRDDLDPAALKKLGRPTMFTADDLLDSLEDEMNSTAWQKTSGIKNGEVFRKLRAELIASNRVEQISHGWKKCT